MKITPFEFEKFRVLLKKKSGIDLSEDKSYLADSRLAPLAKTLSLNTLGELVFLANVDNAVMGRVVDAMTVNETLWFRDGHPFEALKDHLLPDVLMTDNRPIRIWSAASSTGQEPYSIAIIINEFTRRTVDCSLEDFEVIGTDISPSAVEEAFQANYSKFVMGRGLTEDHLQTYFLCKEERFTLVDKIRNAVTFSTQNLFESYSRLGTFHIVFCRNVLIYFDADAKKKVFESMASVIHPGGYLVLGGTENPATGIDGFQAKAIKGRVYHQRLE